MKLLQEGQLPAHVDPAAILNAPPSKRPARDGDGERRRGDDTTEAEEGQDDALKHLEPHPKRNRRSASNTDSDTIDEEDDAVLSELTDREEHDEPVRSSSPSECDEEEDELL